MGAAAIAAAVHCAKLERETQHGCGFQAKRGPETAPMLDFSRVLQLKQ